MRLSDFFGSGTANRLGPIASLPFSGGWLAVRPLTFEQFVRLDSALGEYRPIVAEIAAGKVPDAELKAPLRLAFAILFPYEPSRRLEEATMQEIAAVYSVLAKAHDWQAIEAETGHGDKSATDEQTLGLFWIIEKRTGRRIEDVLSMKIEAAMALVQLVHGDAKRERVANSYRTGENKVTSDDLSSLDLLPGLELSEKVDG